MKPARVPAPLARFPMSGSTGAARSCPPGSWPSHQGSPEPRPSVTGAAFHRRPLVSRLEFGALPNAIPCAPAAVNPVRKEFL
jgi:hypothetical protein